MKKFLVFSFLLTLLHNLVAQNIYMSKSVELSFFSEARIENISAQTKEGSAAFNINTGEIVVKVRIKTFHFTNGLMEEHFNENYMDTDKFPEAIFKGIINEKLDPATPAEIPISIKGILMVHGIPKERTLKGLAIIKENQIDFSSNFLLPVSDHNIDIPNDKISNISQNIEVKINASLLPQIKK